MRMLKYYSLDIIWRSFCNLTGASFFIAIGVETGNKVLFASTLFFGRRVGTIIIPAL